MSDYQYRNDEIVLKSTGSAIPEDFNNREYQRFVKSGQTPDPEFSAEEIKQNAIKAIQEKADSDVNAIIPENMHARVQARRTELIILESRGQATSADIDEANAIDAKWAAMKAIRIKESADIADLG